MRIIVRIEDENLSLTNVFESVKMIKTDYQIFFVSFIDLIKRYSC
jgi:hypothetical protein